MKIVRLGVTLVLLGVTLGCGARMAVTARESEAFVVRAGLFSTAVYRCEADAAGGSVVCTKVEERR